MFVNFLVIDTEIAKLRRDSGQGVLFSRSVFDKEGNNLEYIIWSVPVSEVASVLKLCRFFKKILFPNKNTKTTAKCKAFLCLGI